MRTKRECRWGLEQLLFLIQTFVPGTYVLPLVLRPNYRGRNRTRMIRCAYGLAVLILPLSIVRLGYRLEGWTTRH